MAMEPDPSRVVRLALDHVTAVLGQGLLSASAGDRGNLPRMELTMNDSVLRVEDPQQPLIELSGRDDVDSLRDRLKIVASRHPGVVQTAGPICRIASSMSLLPDAPRELSVEQLGWTEQALARVDVLQLPEGIDVGTWQAIQPRDFALQPGEENPALAASGDLQNAGVNWSAPRIPLRLPAVPSAATMED